jgi:hypothetical protein
LLVKIRISSVFFVALFYFATGCPAKRDPMLSYVLRVRRPSPEHFPPQTHMGIRSWVREFLLYLDGSGVHAVHLLMVLGACDYNPCVIAFAFVKSL